MPGIVGLITKQPREQAERQLLRMVEAIRHESFYETGTWIDESLGVYVGWAARQGSFCSGMPVRSPRGDVVLAFSGEEFRDRKDALEGEPEAGYLLNGYETAEAFLAGLNGRFHGLVADLRRGSATLFNDRYGMHRLYYHEAADGFYFGAEAKAILAVKPELRVPNPQALGELAACGCVLENRTIFASIHGLPAGSAWTFERGGLARKNTYFEAREWEQQEALDEDAFYQKLESVFEKNLPLYLRGRERAGISLTGGLDTRVILAWAKAAPQSLPSYTFGSMFRDNHDVRLARQLAAVCGQSHQVIPIADEFLQRFPHYAERSVYLTEGGVDVYRAADLYVSERARPIAPAKIVGTYGSEIIRQAVMFKPMMPKAGVYRPDFLASLNRARETYARLRAQHPVTFAAFCQSPWYHFGILALEQSQLTVRAPFLDKDFVQTMYQAPAEVRDDIRLRLIRRGSPTLAAIPTDRGVGGDSGPLTSALRRAYLEFTFKAEYAYDYGMPQWLVQFDRAFSWCQFERLFLGRHKMLHFRVWYRGALAGYVQEMLLSSRALQRSYVEPETLRHLVTEHTAGRGNYTTEIHKLLTLEILHRQFFDPR